MTRDVPKVQLQGTREDKDKLFFFFPPSETQFPYLEREDMETIKCYLLRYPLWASNTQIRECMVYVHVHTC